MRAAAVKAARKFPGLKGMDLAKVVSTKKRYQWNEGSIWPRERARADPRPTSACTWWPTTSASSATSCACSPTAAAA